MTLNCAIALILRFFTYNAPCNVVSAIAEHLVIVVITTTTFTSITITIVYYSLLVFRPTFSLLFLGKGLKQILSCAQLGRGSGIRVVLCWSPVTPMPSWHVSTPVCSSTNPPTPTPPRQRERQMLSITLCRGWQVLCASTVELVTGELPSVPSTRSGKTGWSPAACLCMGMLALPVFLYILNEVRRSSVFQGLEQWANTQCYGYGCTGYRIRPWPKSVQFFIFNQIICSITCLSARADPRQLSILLNLPVGRHSARLMATFPALCHVTSLPVSLQERGMSGSRTCDHLTKKLKRAYTTMNKLVLVK